MTVPIKHALWNMAGDRLMVCSLAPLSAISVML
jgi:hypothetical protein